MHGRRYGRRIDEIGVERLEGLLLFLLVGKESGSVRHGCIVVRVCEVGVCDLLVCFSDD